MRGRERWYILDAVVFDQETQQISNRILALKRNHPDAQIRRFKRTVKAGHAMVEVTAVVARRKKVV